MKTVRRIVSLFISCLILAGVLSGCTMDAKSMPFRIPDTRAGADTGPANEPEDADHSRDVSWSKAFMDKSLGEGYATPDSISFYRKNAKGDPEIRRVPIDEVYAAADERGTVPRTEHFRENIGEDIYAVFPMLDYAIENGYSKMVFPSYTLEGSDFFAVSWYISMTYRLNENSITGRTVATFTDENGIRFNYVYLTIMGMDRPDGSTEYRKALRAARKIVDSIPEGSTEYEKAFYLYKYLTDNVRYDEGDDYYDDGWNLLYDALVEGETVCAGYSEALYVLYNLAGIDCFCVYGNISIGDSYGSHVWNAARIDGQYYQFDPTWDEGEPCAYFDFFAVSSEDMEAYYPRTVAGRTDEYCPSCDSSMFGRIRYEEADDEMKSMIILFRGLDFSLNDIDKFPVDNDEWRHSDRRFNVYFSSELKVASSALIEKAVADYIRADDDGYIEYRTGVKDIPGYRICGTYEKDGVNYYEAYAIYRDGRFERLDMVCTSVETGSGVKITGVTFADGTDVFG